MTGISAGWDEQRRPRLQQPAVSELPVYDGGHAAGAVRVQRAGVRPARLQHRLPRLDNGGQFQFINLQFQACSYSVVLWETSIKEKNISCGHVRKRGGWAGVNPCPHKKNCDLSKSLCFRPFWYSKNSWEKKPSFREGRGLRALRTCPQLIFFFIIDAFPIGSTSKKTFSLNGHVR